MAKTVYLKTELFYPREKTYPLKIPTFPSSRFRATGNILQIHLSGFGGSHYEIGLRRNYHEFALHFESSAEICAKRISFFEPQLEVLNQNIGQPVLCGQFENRGWMRIWFEQPVSDLNKGLAVKYADLMMRFIIETFPILQQAYQPAVSVRTSIIKETLAQNKSGSATSITSGSRAEFIALDREIESIRAFLQGRVVTRPTDEKICDWISLCYMVGLYPEGRDLFALISSENVQPWYLEKTKKLARLCDLKIPK